MHVDTKKMPMSPFLFTKHLVEILSLFGNSQWVDLTHICIKVNSLLAILIEITFPCPLCLWSINRPAVLKRYHSLKLSIYIHKKSYNSLNSSVTFLVSMEFNFQMKNKIQINFSGHKNRWRIFFFSVTLGYNFLKKFRVHFSSTHRACTIEGDFTV